jgi:vacuolar protein sorting-associated protein VTA1
VGEAHIENYAVKIFSWADGQERNSVHNKNVVKAFYTAGILFDILSNFTKDLSEDIEKMKKYAKWRAAYIHNCLKNGEVPEVPVDTSYDYDEGAQDLVGPGPMEGGSSGAGPSQGGWNFPASGIAPPQQPSTPTQPEHTYFIPPQQPQIPPQTPEASSMPFEIPPSS